MSWKDELPDELKNHESLKDVKDVAALAKAFVDTKAMVGASVRLPGPDAAPEVKKQFLERMREKYPGLMMRPENEEERKAFEQLLWKELGRPEDAKGYTLEGETDVDGVDTAELAKKAADLGLTRAQFVALAKGVAGSLQDRAKAVKLWQDTLKKDWGVAYAEKLAAAADVAAKLGAPEATVKALREGTLPVEQAKTWANVAKAMGSSAAISQQGQRTAPPRLTPQEAQLQLAEIRGNPAYFDPNTNPALHQSLLAKVDTLMPMAYPDEVGDMEQAAIISED